MFGIKLLTLINLESTALYYLFILFFGEMKIFYHTRNNTINYFIII